MGDYVEIDLNDVVSKKVKSKIGALQSQIENLRNKVSKQSKTIEELKINLQESETFKVLSNKFKTEFNNLKPTKGESGYIEESLGYKQYVYIEKIMDTIFGIKAPHGYLHLKRDWALWQNLAVNYYDHKNELFMVLDILMSGKSPSLHSKVKTNIKSFIMPYEIPKSNVIAFLKGPRSNTNGITYGVTRYWLNSGLGMANVPHDLILKHPCILEDDVFEVACETIKKMKGEWHSLFRMYQYNKLPNDKIERLGELLVGIEKRYFAYDSINNFVRDCISYFNDKTLEYLFSLVVKSKNQSHKYIHWTTLPIKYQYKYLMDKNIEDVLMTLNKYDCNWTLEEKDKFLKEYYAKRKD